MKVEPKEKFKTSKRNQIMKVVKENKKNCLSMKAGKKNPTIWRPNNRKKSSYEGG